MADLNDAVAAAILKQNNQAYSIINRIVTFVKHGDVYVYADYMEAVDRDVYIHKIDAATANSLASIFIAEAAAHPTVQLPYALGCSDIESIFDPRAQNGNLPVTANGKATGSNTDRGPDGYDLGPCQLKAKYLIGQSGIKSITDAWAFALDPTLAIPYFFDVYAGLIAWAQSIESQRTSAWNPKYGVLAWATGAYNFGKVGVLPMLESGDDISHCNQVSDLCAWFSKELNVPNPMAL